MRKRRKDEVAEDGNWCPKHLRLLRSLYGSRLRSLLELLRHEDLQNEQTGLVRDDDTVEYLTLLNHSFAVLSEGAPVRVGRVPVVLEERTNQRWSQQQESSFFLSTFLYKIWHFSFVNEENENLLKKFSRFSLYFL